MAARQFTVQVPGRGAHASHEHILRPELASRPALPAGLPAMQGGAEVIPVVLQK
jgi:hypothetical protein